VNTLGRPLEFDPSVVVVKAMETFWHNGYEATSMTDLTQEMGISKSSLYQSFGSKKQLFETCLTRYVGMLAVQMEKDLEGAKSGFIFIEKLLKSVGNTAQSPAGKKGCLMVSSINEIGQSDSGIALLIDRELELLTQIFIKAIKRAQTEGDIPMKLKPQFIASYLHVSISGLRTMIKAGADSKSIKEVINLILATLK
jgi:TetR/AcrR family transcriptional repressor of nem operon